MYGTRGDYTITLAESGSTTTSEVEGDIVAIDPGSVLEYSLLYSSFVAGDDSSTFTFTGKGGEFADISVSPESVGLDVVIDFLDPSGQSLLDGPLDNSYNTEYIRVLRMPEDGDYTVVVSSYDGAPGDFELLVEESYLSNPASFILASGSSTTRKRYMISPSIPMQMNWLFSMLNQNLDWTLWWNCITMIPGSCWKRKTLLPALKKSFSLSLKMATTNLAW
ncbi:MAG: hypothetical protein M5U34_03320 [Chloroflexi bacterium]|nr:hypothetical protein [Chloroflexota bacterium]